MTSNRRTGLLLALCTAVISGFAVFLNSYGVRAFGSASLYTTAKNVVAAIVLLAVVGLGRRAGARLTRPVGARQWLTLAGAQRFNWKSVLIGFVLFRFFDILKPPPVRQIEQVPGGAGIVLDDIMAGVYGALVLYAAGWYLY